VVQVLRTSIPETKAIEDVVTKAKEEVVEISERQIQTIEPGAAIDQGYLIPVPAEYDAFKLELKGCRFYENSLETAEKLQES